jgi:hypothetical protein
MEQKNSKLLVEETFLGRAHRWLEERLWDLEDLFSDV